MNKKSEWTQEQLDALARVALKNPEREGLLRALDRVTDGRISVLLEQDNAHVVAPRLTKAGGARPGAGRPKKGEESQATERIMIRLTKGELERLLALVEPKERKATAARRLLLWAMEEEEKERGEEILV